MREATLTLSKLCQPDALPGELSGRCSICGIREDGMYSREWLLDKTSANLTAIFDLTEDTVCRYCTAVWREPKKWHRAIYASPRGVIFPVISVESVTDDRPTWSQVFRQIPIDEPRALVLTTDPKKRVWPFARASTGRSASIYVHDPSRGISANRLIDLPTLRSTLDLIEDLYTLGFSKPAISESLFTAPFKHIQTIGLARVGELQEQLAAVRRSPEFIPALLAAQKGIA